MNSQPFPPDDLATSHQFPRSYPTILSNSLKICKIKFHNNSITNHQKKYFHALKKSDKISNLNTYRFPPKKLYKFTINMTDSLIWNWGKKVRKKLSPNEKFLKSTSTCYKNKLHQENISEKYYICHDSSPCKFVRVSLLFCTIMCLRVI